MTLRKVKLMILVINLNASLDKRYELVDFAKGKIVRAKSVDNTPGGKGIHVANVDTILGEDTVVTGFLGGKTGEFVAGKLYDYGITGDFVDVAGETRSCLAILTEDGAQTEILEPGPDVSPEELKKFRTKYAELLEKAAMFRSECETEWICLNCGNIVSGKDVPESCPLCSHDRGFFVPYKYYRFVSEKYGLPGEC